MIKKFLFITGYFFLSVYGIAQNAPISTISVVNSYTNTATVPVTAINFTNIGSFSLEIEYDQTIALPVSVTVGPLLGGSVSVNLTNPGSILVSWYTYPGLTLSGSPVILSLNFSRVVFGTSALTWLDNGPSCAWYDVNFNLLNDVPTTTYYIPGTLTFNTTNAPHTMAPVVNSCENLLIGIPVKVTAFNNIGGVTLTLNYNYSALNYQSFINNSGFPGLTVNTAQQGTLIVSGTIPSNGTGFSLPDSSVLVTLNFNYSSGTSGLSWYDNGASCQYLGAPPGYLVLNDSPQGTYYINGSVTGTPSPGPAGAISGPPGGNVCLGETGVNFSVFPVQNATAYFWALPTGAIITGGGWTDNIIVTFDSTAINGNLIVYGNNICGNGQNSPPFLVNVNTPPSITSQPVSPDTVNADGGSASFTAGATGSSLTYQWQVYSTTWTNLSDSGIYSGVSLPTLTITNPPASMNGNHYRCVVSGFCPPQAITNGEAMLSVRILTGIQNNDINKNDNNKTLTLDISPNPAISDLTLSYFLHADGHVRLEIRSITGEIMEVLFDSNDTKGSHKLTTVLDLDPGLYLITLTLQTMTDMNMTIKKLILQ